MDLKVKTDEANASAVTPIEMLDDDCWIAIFQRLPTISDKIGIEEGQPNSMSDSNKSTGRFADATTNQISSGNYSGAKTLIVYENDESVEIKEEIIDDHERRQDGEQNLLTENNQLDEKCISSRNKSAAKTTIVYEYDETLEIKEEIIQDQQTTSERKIDKKYDSRLNTVNKREPDIFSTNRLQTHKKKKIQDSKTKSNKKYICQECARSYLHRSALNTHQKFECGVEPQFICKFCDKRFARKGSMSRHVGQMHQNTNSNSNISQAIYNCHKCFRSYNSLGALKQHERLKHAAVKPQFLCDICGYKMNKKSNLLKHISSCHLKNSKISQASHKCDKCSRVYSSLRTLKQHDRLKHAPFKPNFICEVCGYQTNMKSHLSSHVTLRHLKKSGIPQAGYSCDKCFRSYSSLGALKQHKRLKHETVKPQLVCDV